MFDIYWTQVGPIDDAIKEIEYEMAEAAANYDIAHVLEANVRRNELINLKREKMKEVEACMKKSNLYGRKLIKTLLVKKEGA